MGFSFDDNTEKCECDSSMQSKLLPITNCNINDQTILRPANSWMTAETYNDSYAYHISPNCPFHYCLPQSSYLNFSTPNSQCQFNWGEPERAPHWLENRVYERHVYGDYERKNAVTIVCTSVT